MRFCDVLAMDLVVRIGDHRSELVEDERRPPPAEANLAEDDRPRRCHRDRQCCHQHQRRQQNDQEQSPPQGRPPALEVRKRSKVFGSVFEQQRKDLGGRRCVPTRGCRTAGPDRCRCSSSTRDRRRGRADCGSAFQPQHRWCPAAAGPADVRRDTRVYRFLVCCVAAGPRAA